MLLEPEIGGNQSGHTYISIAGYPRMLGGRFHGRKVSPPRTTRQKIGCLLRPRQPGEERLETEIDDTVDTPSVERVEGAYDADSISKDSSAGSSYRGLSKSKSSCFFLSLATLITSPQSFNFLNFIKKSLPFTCEIGS